VISIRLFLCTLLGIVVLDVSDVVFTRGSIALDVVTVGNVRSNGVLCWFSSKGGILGIPRV
jgi:hypothetical protein